MIAPYLKNKSDSRSSGARTGNSLNQYSVMTVILAMSGLLEMVGRSDRTLGESENFCLGELNQERFSHRG